ncbi:MAG: hypothetical protein M9894_39945 [Planctomycetes bacterium]|nr:hypothetical protein [Planctomycetota bacterium]
MSIARRLVPGRTHTATRRTARRCFFLTPSPEVNQVVLYALGVAVNRHGVDLHAFMAESTHHHTCATDDAPEARLSDFFESFHSLTARALNAHYGRGENFWCVGSYDNVEVFDKATLEEQLLYLWSNPVKDGLVERPEDWPGVRFLPEDFGRTVTVARPESAFFGGRRPADWEPTHPAALVAFRRARREAARRGGGAARRRDRGGRPPRPGARPPKEPAPRPDRRDRRKLPTSVTFEITPPPGYDHMSLAEVRAHFRRLLDARVAQILAERRAQGLTRVLGPDAVRNQDPRESAGDTFPTFGRNPRIACRDQTRRIALLAELVNWRVSYRVARTAWRGGERDVVFPHGAYGLPRLHGARVAPAATGPPTLE